MIFEQIENDDPIFNGVHLMLSYKYDNWYRGRYLPLLGTPLIPFRRVIIRLIQVTQC